MLLHSYRLIFLAILSLAGLTAGLQLAEPQTAPAELAGPVLAAPVQDVTPTANAEEAIPDTGGAEGELSEQNAERFSMTGDLPFLILLGIVFLVVIIGLVSQSSRRPTQ